MPPGHRHLVGLLQREEFEDRELEGVEQIGGPHHRRALLGPGGENRGGGGGGTARSGRSRSSSVSAASLRSANQLVRVGVGAVDAVSAAPSVPGVGVIAYEISDLGCTALRTPVKMGAWLTIRRSAMSIQGGRKLRMEITR